MQIYGFFKDYKAVVSLFFLIFGKFFLSNQFFTYFSKVMSVSFWVIDWYLKHKRVLPWRECSDPYRIWVSEIILQQTRIAQGLDYYLRFIEQFPDIESLANASEDDVLLLWQGLGYYSRARNMHTAAKEIMERHQGVFPSSYVEIRALKGVGDYTAAAIASFAYKLPYATLDGNVFRVLSRYFGISTPIDSPAGKREFQTLAQELIDPKRPDLFNQGMMDLGATICLPSSPLCHECPLADSCLANGMKEQTLFPVKAKKIVPKERFFLYLVVLDDGHAYIRKRGGKDIWKGLYEFPMIEVDKPIEEAEIGHLLQQFSSDFTNITLHEISDERLHILTHQRLHARFVTATGKPTQTCEYLRVPIEELSNYAFPQLLSKGMRHLFTITS